jgi:hypothetical protein
MNLDAFFQTIKSPHNIPASEIPVYKDLSDKFPFSQLFPIVYLKALSVNKDIRFEEELKNYAYRITDRAKLFDLIHQENNVQQEQIIENSKEEILIEEKIEEIQSTFTENLAEVSRETINLEENVPQTTEKLEIEEYKFEEEVTKPIEDELEKEFLSNIISSSYSLEHQEKELNQNKENVDLKRENIEEKIDLNQSRSFTSWLKIGKNQENQEILEENKKEKIIDTFIKNDLKIGKPKAEFFSAPKKAKESVNEEKLIYSETLANIYALQGNFPKAIKAFEQLSLTIPEKKLYFAKKIEELNKKINP